MSDALTARNLLMTRWGMLKSERSSWIEHWMEISNYLLPRSGRFFVQDRNKGNKRANKIYDSTGTRALRTLGAGLQGGATSPARPWFRLTISDQDMAKSHDVQVWLEKVTELMFAVFQKSNTYRSFHSLYEELGAFGTGASIVVQDFRDVIRHYPLTAGEYCIAADDRGEICSLYREFQMTVSNMVQKFGKAKCSMTVQNLYDRGMLDSWVTVLHCIEPRIDRVPGKIDNLNMPWSSRYLEYGATDGNYLRESGFKRFPVLTPRWGVAGGDIYGNSPGMEALGDIRQLQHEQLRKAQVIDYKSNPPLQVPLTMKNQQLETLPGGISFYDPTSANGGIKTAFDVQLDIGELREDIMDVRERINGCFYVDLFRLLDSQTNPRMTATEVAELHEEKLLLLGPTIERLHNEMLDPAIEGCFHTLVEVGLLPPPPDELQGVDLQVEYTSVLAQAQRAVQNNGVDRFLSTLGAVAQFKPEIVDNLDADYLANSYGQNLGIDPSIIVAGPQVALVRKQRAQQQAAQAQAEQMNQMSQTAKNLGQTPTTGGNAASDVANLFSQ
jgi:hypothetical protein